MTDPKLAVVVKGWPRLSETFIAQELVALEEAGVAFDIWSLRFPYDDQTHPLHDRLRARVFYLPEYLHQEPLRVLRAWWQARRLPGYAAARAIWWRDLRRDVTRNRVRRFGQACVMAVELPQATRGLYAHFLHTPSSVARYAGVMRRLPWSFSAHAKDIWTSPDWELREKLADDDAGARFGVTCTGFGATHLKSLAADADRVALVYHGLDLSRFPPPPDSRAAGPFRMLSVGRLVEKKGFDRLVEALALLPEVLDWRWTHVGGGDLGDTLRARAQALGIADRITWVGKADQPRVVAEMRTADLFVLPSRTAANGDRDGLPNVLMEAASQKLPILSTPVSAIPEFITDGVHGRLVADAPDVLARAMADMAQDTTGRAAMAEAAFARLTADFGIESGISRLKAKLLDMLR